MKLPRRQFLHLAAGAAALPAVSRIAGAQAYPTRTVTLIVPFAAGGATDVAARVAAEHMSRILGQQTRPISFGHRIYVFSQSRVAHRECALLRRPTSRGNRPGR
jgi:hypothetical protein